jgi:hypothetical protein
VTWPEEARLKPDENADERGFACPVGAQQTKKLAFLDVETDILQGAHGAPA